MLFDVAAILTSVALGPAAEAVTAPQSLAAVSAPAATGTGTPFIGPEPYLGPTPYLGPDLAPVPAVGPDLTSTSLTGIRLLEQFGALTPAQLAEFVEARPDAIADLLAHPPVPSAVTQWWATLTPSVRSGLLQASPQLVGNLDGLPYEVRDGANREFLDESMQHLRDVIDSASGRTVVDQARQQLEMLEAISAALEGDPGRPGPQRTLMSLDVTGQGRAAIVVGDLRTADYVSYLVPGMFFTIENQMVDWTNSAVALHDEQVSWLKLFAARSGSKAGAVPAPTATVATIAWIGYHTPNLTNVGGLDNAIQGRDALASAIEGLQSVRGGDQPFITVVAHSYGSTAALMALAEDSFEIDALAMVGSPGSDAQSVDELHVRNANVWVGEAPWDPVPNSAFFGSDPGSPSYGAHLFSVDGGVDVITGRALAGSLGHIEYFAPGSQSMRNLALIGIDRAEFVSDGTSADAARTLSRLH